MTINAPCLTLLPMVEKANKHQDFANRLTEEMRRQRRSVKDLSLACDVTYEMARRYTLGTAKPRDEKLQKIADWLNVQAAWLDYGEGESAAGTLPENEFSGFHASEPHAESDAEFRELSEDEKRLVRVFRQFPSAEAKNMLLAFEMRYKQLYDFFLKYANTPQK
ncbi:helix-turn-helix transcriptional regulator [Enterobacter roggenkampii]|uniref:helix-turn-helix domain-containing protein n=1 Tax=Enterobacter roggenkampii TaxID=1812935 RepID=UPI0018C1E894|nr:helix-turn-helix transcriptional regulator [Enterobacter roggenkampii]MBG0696796.1 helix-turn-helix transcriptional regulator [Enterobacter roggenkampii]